MNSESSKSQIKILILSGPNLNLLGERDPETYGDQTLENHIETAEKAADQKGMTVEHLQSNHEGELIEKIQKIGFSYDGIIINAGGFTHTSVALRDAISSVTTPAIEVHISNILSREEFRKKSYLSDVCSGIISGLGLMGYEAAINYFSEKND